MGKTRIAHNVCIPESPEWKSQEPCGWTRNQDSMAEVCAAFPPNSADCVWIFRPSKVLVFPGFLTFTFYRTSSLILPWLSVDIIMTWYLRCFAKYDSIHAHPDVPAHYSGIYIPPTLPLVPDVFLHLKVELKVINGCDNYQNCPLLVESKIAAMWDCLLLCEGGAVCVCTLGLMTRLVILQINAWS